MSEPTSGTQHAYVVWDVPTRVLHWTLAVTALCSMVLGGILYLEAALGLSESGIDFVNGIHEAVGYALLGCIVLRLLWAFFGNAYARWGRMLPGGRGYIRAFATYAVGLVRGSAPFYLGHNPVGRLAVLVLLGLTTALSISGLVLSEQETVESLLLAALDEAEVDRTMQTLKPLMFAVHRYSFFLLLLMTFFHVVGIVFTELREGGTLVSAMITGRKITSKTPVDEQT